MDMLLRTHTALAIILLATIDVCRSKVVFAGSENNLQENTVQACGSTISVEDGSNGTITSPYSRSCQYTIVAPIGKRIQINFDKIQFKDNLIHSFNLKIYEGNNTNVNPIKEHRGLRTYPASYLSKANSLTLIFENPWGGAFSSRLEYRAQSGCSLAFQLPQGMFDSSSILRDIDTIQTCSYQITGKPGSKISLIFSEMSLDSEIFCINERLSIYEGIDESGKLEDVRCGNKTTQYLSRSNKLFLHFKTNSIHVGSAFKIFYVIGETGCDKTFTETKGLIDLPFYPFHLPYNMQCFYKLFVKKQANILLKIQDIRGYPFSNEKIVVYEGTNSSVKPSKRLFYEYSQVPYFSKGNAILIALNSENYKFPFNFRLTYEKTIGCSFNLSSTSSSSYISSPGFPRNYPASAVCNYLITAKKGKTIRLNFQNLMNLGGSIPCNHNVSVYDGANVQSEHLDTFCGSDGNFKSFNSKGESIFIQFKSDSLITASGFYAAYYDGPESGCFNEVHSNSHYGGKQIMKSINSLTVYPNNASCTYKIKSISGSTIILYSIDVSMQSSSGCQKDSVTMYDGQIANKTSVATVCGKSKIASNFQTNSGELIFLFKSDDSIPGKGFSVQYEVCGGIIGHMHPSYNRTIYSPRFPEKYTNNLHCVYEVRADYGNIHLEFSNFALEESEGCSKDYLRIYNGSVSNETLLETRCGNDKRRFQIDALKVILVFNSDLANVGKGFEIQYKSCSFVLTEKHGHLTSPIFRNGYQSICHYLIKPKATKRIRFHISHIKLRENDYLRVYRSSKNGRRLTWQLHNATKENVSFTLERNSLFVVFTTNYYNYQTEPSFFKASYQAYTSACKLLSPCQNNGACIDYADTDYTCKCLSGFYGKNCSTNMKDLCNSNPCRNGGICANVFGNGLATIYCDCPSGFNGTFCENYLGSKVKTNTSPRKTVLIIASSVAAGALIAMLTVIIIIIWLKKKKNNKVATTIEPNKNDFYGNVQS